MKMTRQNSKASYTYQATEMFHTAVQQHEEAKRMYAKCVADLNRCIERTNTALERGPGQSLKDLHESEGRENRLNILGCLFDFSVSEQ
jgi:hypothetical protein